MSAQPIVIAEIVKNSREVLKVTLSRYQGHALADVRVFVPVDGMDCLTPTKKGVSVRVGLLDEIIAALTKAKDEAKALGWIGGDD